MEIKNHVEIQFQFNFLSMNVLTKIQILKVLPAERGGHGALDGFWRLVGPETHESSVRRSVGHEEEEKSSVETQRIQLNLTEAPCLRIVPVLSDCFPETCGGVRRGEGGGQTEHQ